MKAKTYTTIQKLHAAFREYLWLHNNLMFVKAEIYATDENGSVRPDGILMHIFVRMSKQTVLSIVRDGYFNVTHCGDDLYTLDITKNWRSYFDDYKARTVKPIAARV